jgi:hypothetical protein
VVSAPSIALTDATSEPIKIIPSDAFAYALTNQMHPFNDVIISGTKTRIGRQADHFEHYFVDVTNIELPTTHQMESSSFRL